MNLSIRQLQAFREVMRTGSVSNAARVLGRTQPAISSLIANLEAELGIALFRRQRGKMVPTPEAQYFLGEAEAILDRLALSTRTMHEIGTMSQGRLNIACMPAAALVVMPQLISIFLKDKPDVKVSLMMRGSPVIEEWIASQQYDIGVTETPAKSNATLSEDFKMACVCALPASDPLAAKTQITARDLDNAPMAALPEGHPNLIDTQAAFNAMGARFNQRFELRNFHPAMTLVENGLCYCVCDPITAAGHIEALGGESSIVFRPFAPQVVLQVSILQPAHRPPSILAESFVSLLCDELQRIHRLF
ncbi:LysR family transcriptional regulator [Rhodobacteraceae bacterium B1Z28]|uniref:LysR family transcriptional regulator n=1 Tax=Ruegeria haliotis TaxID=2747601 RepID=A0ABX2PTZ1_9RHOB|nr:LysR substrate-binding domain-containing protein [Ruegeria haliotis]NVO56612.1 LysR family transcriptional regulator [Ruegeria haliotis]